MNIIDMSKNKKFDMTKEDGSAIKTLFFGVNWNANRYSGEAAADLDLNTILTDSDRNVAFSQDIVNYKTYGDGSGYAWIKYSGDNQTGEDSHGMEFNGQHYDEGMIIYTDKIPTGRDNVFLTLSIFRAVQRLQNFGMVENVTLHIFDYENPNDKCWKYDLSENSNFEDLNAVEIGQLYRYGDKFRFKALGSGYVGGMTELFKNFGLEINEGRD